MPLVVIGLSHHTSPVTVRERFAVAEAKIPGALDLLRQSGVVEGLSRRRAEFRCRPDPADRRGPSRLGDR